MSEEILYELNLYLNWYLCKNVINGGLWLNILYEQGIMKYIDMYV